MAQSIQAQASQEAAGGAPPSVGYFLLPRQLRKDCQQVGINTLKLVLLIADATLGWDFSRWAALTYATIVADAGIPNDACVRRAIAEAVASALIEVQTTSAGTLYAIHRRYWLLARIQPKWHLYKRVPYDPADDPLNESQPAITMIAQLLEDAALDTSDAITMIAEPAETVVSPPADAIITIAQPLGEASPDGGAAITMIATDYHHDSDLLSPGEQAAITMTAQPLSESSSHLAPRAAKEIYKEEKEIRKEGAEKISDEPTMQDIDALQQRQVAKHALQKLLAEQEQLRALLPSQRGWGAAQGRLRALAWDITRLQDEAAVQTPAASTAEPEAAGEADPSAARRSPALHLPQRGNDPTEPAQDTRWQRLTQLQGELAHLKKSPSMRLLARQRIPRLEAEIKHLVASLAESA